MRIPGEIYEATFASRPNRFLAVLQLDGEPIEAYVPNPGRMYEIMIPGRKMFVRYSPADHRRTDFTLVGVRHDDVMVSLDANLPNRFMKRMLTSHSFPFFDGYDQVKSEPQMYEGRFDFLLSGSSGIQIVEVKSCTLVVGGRAVFPDAPTERGARHLRGLVRALEDRLADRAVVVFVIQRPDALVFSPNDVTDPKFGNSLRDAAKAGVEVIPITTRVRNWKLEFLERIPTELGPLSP